MRISYWSSDVCSSDLDLVAQRLAATGGHQHQRVVAAGDVVDDGGLLAAEGGVAEDPLEGLEWWGVVHERRVASRRRVSVGDRSEEHTSELQSLMRISYAVFCLQKQMKIIIEHISS